ncbi:MULTISPECIES: nucleoside triphosphate pyrophosphatase [Trueperella]|uniref:Maf family protein n=1 Tax=Trueperella TaxID=1069494 RepID=UPI0025E6F5E6|nr:MULTISPECIES: nucleoside triphosphate pyrophosphatase [Trueperella]MCI7304862.1 Maf family nucleotide pyrophosphatase [Trueperella sp.]
MMQTLLLASASPARKATLIAAHIPPLVAVADVDEDALLAAAKARGPVSAAEQVQLLAVAKAKKVAAELDAGTQPTVIVGCDSMLEMDGQVVGKPHTPEVARERLRAMRGNAGDLHTGHCVIDVATGRMAVATSTATVHIAHLTDAEIEAYIGTGEPLVVAGSFTIDGYGGPFVERIEGDHHGVVGISLPLLRDLLAELGHAITDFWQ